MKIADLCVALVVFRCGVHDWYASLALLARLDLHDFDRPAMLRRVG